MKILAGVFASFDQMCWTIPSPRMGELVHKATFGELTKKEVQLLAGMFACYHQLIVMPERVRRQRIRNLREALKLAASQDPTSPDP